MNQKLIRYSAMLFFAAAGFLLLAPRKNVVYASTTDGTIDATNKYAWGENIGWINFGVSEGNVHVTDSGLTGYAWGENIGWISLHCSNSSSCGTVNYGVSNDGEGALTGYAWGENIGWIDFDPTYGGVTINSSGDFTGYAWGENIGWIVFNCSATNSCGTASYKVSTDWRPESSRATSTPSPSPSPSPSPNPGIPPSLLAPSAPPPADPEQPRSPPAASPADPPSAPSPTPAREPVINRAELRSPTVRFLRPLQIGASGEDVRRLQQFLNANGYRVARSGAGSPGQETTFFGARTQAALRQFQAQYGLSAEAGVAGESTLVFVNTLAADAPPPAPGMPVADLAALLPPDRRITRTLRFGDVDETVRSLQAFLNANGYRVAALGPGSPEQETTFFGLLTRRALRQFQAAFGIQGEAGSAGPKTREFINSLRILPH